MGEICKGSSVSWTGGRSGGYCKWTTLGCQCRRCELAEEGGLWNGREGSWRGGSVS